MSEKHGHSRRGAQTTEYVIWKGIRDRCHRVTGHAFASYGGRGITVSQEWDASFERFYADMGPRPSKDHSIDRIDTNGPYSKANCRWATRSEQNNNKTNNRRLVVGGQEMNISEACARYGVQLATAQRWLDAGNSPDNVFLHKVRTVRKRISTKERAVIFQKHGGMCDICGGKIDAGKRWDVSHRVPLALGGADDESNWFPAHENCHRRQTATCDIPAIGKAKRREAKHIGAKAPSRNPLPGSRASGIRKRMSGKVERW